MSDNSGFSGNALKVLEKRYLKRDSYGNAVETPEDMFNRVAKTVAKGDEVLSKQFFDVMMNKYFMPNSPTLMNAGRELGQLSACFVLPVDDSLAEIFETIKNTALIHQSGGGTGFSFSRLRPKNSVVRSTMGVSSGPVSFMEVFNSATEAVKQGGTRRGANMGILRVDHPDILEFITSKSDNTKLNNFNISVAITDKFMEAVKNGTDYELINPQNNTVSGTLNARKVFDLIVEMGWKNGEPGVIFIDRINRDNPTPLIGRIESTNPCGEVPLLPYEACNLGSVNLGKMVENKVVNWNLLEKTVKTAVRFLDNVIDVNHFPLPQIAEMVQNNRKTGLGVMGWADMLIQSEISYASDEAVKLAGQVMEFIDYVSKKESVEISKEKGRFKNFKGSVYDSENYLYNKYRGKSAGKISDDEWFELDKQISKYGIRNATTTCIAPTGTISMIASASGGIEPLFGLVFSRLIMDKTEMLEVNPFFEKYAKNNGFYSEDLMKQIAEKGSVSHIDDVADEVKRIFVTAHDIAPYWHVKMQSAFQLHTDNAVSKTVNFVENATQDDIKNVYLMAYENDLKGITVYRNNSRQFQPMNISDTKPKTETEIKVEKNVTKSKKCPECGAEIQMGEGCFICPNCGYSGCS